MKLHKFKTTKKKCAQQSLTKVYTLKISCSTQTTKNAEISIKRQ